MGIAIDFSYQMILYVNNKYHIETYMFEVGYTRMQFQERELFYFSSIELDSVRVTRLYFI